MGHIVVIPEFEYVILRPYVCPQNNNMAKKKTEKQPVKLNRIKAVLAEKDKTQIWLGEKLGVSTQTVSNWSQNHSQPSIPDLKRIADLLGVDMCALLNQ